MTDPSDLLRRAYYAEIAESEKWLAAHPASVASLTNLLTPKSD